MLWQLELFLLQVQMLLFHLNFSNDPQKAPARKNAMATLHVALIRETVSFPALTHLLV